jgi:hypothetical protein
MIYSRDPKPSYAPHHFHSDSQQLFALVQPLPSSASSGSQTIFHRILFQL